MEERACLAEVSVLEQILRKFPEILGELSIRKQCVPGSLFSLPLTRVPGSKAKCGQAPSG